MSKIQHKIQMKKSIKGIMIALICILTYLPFSCWAQDDSTYIVDTTKVDTSTNTYENSEYVSKHSYDSSDKYFNSKDFYDDSFTLDTIILTKSYFQFIDSLKKSKDFDYVYKIEDFHQKQARIQKRTDSLGKEGRKRELIPEQVLIESISPIFRFLFHPITQYIIWAVIVCIFIGGVLLFLTENKISLWSKNAESIPETENIVGDDVNIFQLKYQELLQKALLEGNLRLYIRIQYLQTIKLLSEKQLIQFKPEHTNFIYLLQMQKSKLYATFFTITRHYEYVWYGKFDLSSSAFEQISKEINQFQQQIKQN